MYYSDITNPDLVLFHGFKVPSFTAKLSDVLTDGWCKVETITANELYKVYPLFYTDEIVSSNPNDKILENKCIICEKKDDTYITFLNKSYNGIKDYYSNSGAMQKTIGDSLTTAEFNSIVDLIRQNITHSLDFRITETVTGNYGKYLFDLDGVTFLDDGVLITDETISAQPRVKLVDNSFHYSTYTLTLKVFHYTGVNILDEVTAGDYKEIETITIDLVPDTWVDIPVTDLNEGYIISFDANITIRHNIPVLPNIVKNLTIESSSDIVQKDDYLDVAVNAFDIGWVNAGAGHDIYFYEVLNPGLIFSCSNPIIQSGEKANISVKVVDDDGSLIVGERVDFYEEYEISNIDISADKRVIQTDEYSDIMVKVKDADGSLVSGETVYFYEKMED